MRKIQFIWHHVQYQYQTQEIFISVVTKLSPVQNLYNWHLECTFGGNDGWGNYREKRTQKTSLTLQSSRTSACGWLDTFCTIHRAHPWQNGISKDFFNKVIFLNCILGLPHFVLRLADAVTWQPQEKDKEWNVLIRILYFIDENCSSQLRRHYDIKSI